MEEELNIENLQEEFKRADEFAKLESSDDETQVGAKFFGEGSIFTNTFVDNATGLPSTRPSKYEYIIHAEINLLLKQAYFGRSTKNKIVVCTLSPCQSCIRALFQAGVREIYYRDLYRAHNTNMKDIKVTETPYGPYTHMLLENY